MKLQGLFSKSYRPNRYARFSAAGSRSGGPDLVSLGSNHGRPTKIGRLWMDEAWAAARGNAGDVSRGGARQYSPEFGDFEAPGSVRGGVWPGMITETCVIHPRLLLGAGRAGAAVSTAEAARRSPSSSELGAWAPRARQGLRDLAHRGQGVRAVLTGGRGGRRRDAAARRRGTTAMA